MPDHLDDLDSDFRVFYRIDGIGDEIFPDGMTAPRFLALAYRVGAYEGVMAARIANEHQDDQAGSQTPPRAAQRARGRTEEVPSDKAVLKAHPAFADLID